MTAEDYKRLHSLLDQARDELAQSPDWCEATLRGLLCDEDWNTLGNAARVAHRLYSWRNWPRVDPDHIYLPAPEPVEPQSLRA